MISENIITFLKNGELTNFPFGTLQETVIECLGENHKWTLSLSKRDKRPAMVKYDKTEFYFNNHEIQKLCGIQITYSQTADKKKLEMDYNDFRHPIDVEKTKAILTDNHIEFQEGFWEFDQETKIIKTEGEIVLYFSDENRLEKLSKFITEEM